MTSPLPRVILKKGRERSLLNRHPWVFSGALEGEQQAHDNKSDASCCRTLAVGDPALRSLGVGGPALRSLGVGGTVAVVSSSGETLGYGSYSPASQIRVRMLSFDPKQVPDEAFVEGLVASAIGRRADFFVRNETNAVRLLNAENDGLPGVVADSYDGHIVCQFTAAGAEFWKDTIVQALLKFAPGAKGVSERTDLKDRIKEGLEKKVGQESRSTSNLQPSFRVLAGEEPPELIEVFEGPCKFLVDVRKGHKTGFYLDQRDARAAVGALANGADVLNCFSYTGGFGLACAASGAMSVTQVDVSAEALALARKNEMLQHACGTKFVYEESDVFQYLRTCRDARKTFDLIVLDPPKFAETKSQVMKAARGYKDINLLAMKLLRPGGVLATFSCSGAMTADLFDKILAEAAVDAKRDFQVIGRTRQGADHPVSLSFPEGWYLKGVLLRAR